MATLKTKPTEITAQSYLAAIADDARRADCEAIAALMQKATKCPPVMWGASIVGFDKYQYTYDSGHSGEMCLIGFSSRAGDISVYLMPGYDEDEVKAMLAALGKHKLGKSCLYVKRLADVDLKVLEKLIARSVKVMRAKYPKK
jgi:hypothetical protein